MYRFKKFFGIKKGYEFEVADLTCILTVLNVLFIILGFWWAPFFGIGNCIICLAVSALNGGHINNYVTQVSLLVLNIYFLSNAF